MIYDQILEVHDRYLLYFRIANINQGAPIGTIFRRKHENVEIYIKSLFAQKKKIESQIDFYYKYVQEKLGLKADIDGNQQEEQERKPIEATEVEVEQIESPKQMITGALSQGSNRS